MKHIIGKQMIDLAVENTQEAPQVQERLRRLYYDELLPFLEGVFDSVSNEDEMISINEMQIDLGNITAEQLSGRSNIDKILYSLSEQVYLYLNRYPQANDPNIQLARKTLSVFQQWLFYMQKGYLPWNADSPDLTWYQEVLEAGATDHLSIEKLCSLIINDSRVADRIILQHEKDFLAHIIELITAKNQQLLPDLVEEIITAIIYVRRISKKGTIVPNTIRQSIWKSILVQSAKERKNGSLSVESIMEKLIAENFSPSLIKRIVQSGTIFPKMKISRHFWEMKAERRDNDRKSEPDTNEQSNSNQETDTILDIDQKKAVVLPQDTSSLVPGLNTIISSSKEEISGSMPEVADSETDISNVSEDGIFAGQAGLVLIHPFLYAFLKHINLADDGKFADHHAQQKSILLFHYLATGKLKPEEHELVIPKVLCDYPMENTVDTSIVLESKYLEGAEELLKDVIEQWEIMKGTSVDGLREAFLQRKGKLSFTNDTRLLQVEKNSIDMLLDRLTWSIHYVKLPWMKKMLKVQWR